MLQSRHTDRGWRGSSMRGARGAVRGVVTLICEHGRTILPRSRVVNLISLQLYSRYVLGTGTQYFLCIHGGYMYTIRVLTVTVLLQYYYY